MNTMYVVIGEDNTEEFFVFTVSGSQIMQKDIALDLCKSRNSLSFNACYRVVEVFFKELPTETKEDDTLSYGGC